jgi:phosphate butyryltransferase
MVKNFQEVITLAQQKGKITLAVAAAQDDSVLHGIHMAKELNLVEPILVGDAPQIKKIIDDRRFNLADAEVVNVKEETLSCYKAIELGLVGRADAIMKGGIDSAGFLRTVLDPRRGLRTEKLVSCISVLEDPEKKRLLYLADAVVSTCPDLMTKVQIIENAVDFRKVMGISRPRIAAVSAVELVTPSIPSTMDAACLSKMSERGQLGDALVDGPFALDNLFSLEAAKRKHLNSPLVEDWDLLLAPNIEAANGIYKLLEYVAKYLAIGVFVGTKVQVVQVPRESSPESKLLGIATSILMINDMHRG